MQHFRRVPGRRSAAAMKSFAHRGERNLTSARCRAGDAGQRRHRVASLTADWSKDRLSSCIADDDEARAAYGQPPRPMVGGRVHRGASRAPADRRLAVPRRISPSSMPECEHANDQHGKCRPAARPRPPTDRQRPYNIDCTVVWPVPAECDVVASCRNCALISRPLRHVIDHSRPQPGRMRDPRVDGSGHFPDIASVVRSCGRSRSLHRRTVPVDGSQLG